MGDSIAADPEARRLFLERLPWYINGTLRSDEADWMRSACQASSWAARMKDREEHLQAAAVAAQPSARGDLGRSRLMSLVAQSPAGERKVPSRKQGSVAAQWLQGLADLLGRPQFAFAAAALVIGQAAILAWMVAAPSDVDQMRSVGVTQAPTLRVTFVQDATEAGIRQALIAAGARLVGGPNQFGEYWVASSMNSLEEVRKSLQGSGVVGTITIDPAGPRGR
jgi:hypothetical protein